MCPTPAATLEQIGPGDDFELGSTALPAILKVWMSFGADLLLQGDLGSDVEPFPLHPGICDGLLTQLRQ